MLPVYEATGSGNPKIIEVKEGVAAVANPVVTTAPETRRAPRTVASPLLSDITNDRKGKDKLKPKHTFDLVDSSIKGPNQGFVMVIELPEEVRKGFAVRFHWTACAESLQPPLS